MPITRGFPERKGSVEDAVFGGSRINQALDDACQRLGTDLWRNGYDTQRAAA